MSEFSQGLSRIESDPSTVYGEFESLATILAYMNGARRVCHMVHNATPDRPFSGTACVLIEVTPSQALIRIANGDMRWVPTSQVGFRI